MSSRRLISWFLALLLLLGQAAAFAHELSHLRTHDTALPDKVCEVCIAQAQLGTAMPPSLVTLASPPDTCIFLSAAAPLRVDLSPRPACARAPPAPSST